MASRAERILADSLREDPIEFYASNNAYGCFSNFSKHPLRLPNPFTGVPCLYQTSEHRYQAMKSSDQKGHDYVVASRDASGSQNRGREVRLREGWGDSRYDLCWYVMVETVLSKALQHADVKRKLLSTRERVI